MKRTPKRLIRAESKIIGTDPEGTELRSRLSTIATIEADLKDIEYRLSRLRSPTVKLWLAFCLQYRELVRRYLLRARGRRDVKSQSLRPPKWWTSVGSMLPKKAEREAFEPAYNNMLTDYLKRASAKPLKIRRLRFWFSIVTCFTLIESLRAYLANRAFGFLKKWWPRL